MRQRTNAGRVIRRQAQILGMKTCYLLQKFERRPSFLPEPTVTIAYTCVSQSPSSDTLARRFLDSFRAHAPGYPCELVVLCNGGPLSEYTREVFDGSGVRFFERGNEGWDIGGYIELAKDSRAELLVCLGESVHFHRAGWLARLVAEWQRHGAGIYGCFSSYTVRPHLNTTAFAVSPWLLAKAAPVRTKEDRYEFEHGAKAFWRKLYQEGYEARLVTWDGSYEPPEWRKPAGILWRDEQQNCLVSAKITESYRTAPAVDRFRWALTADTLTVRDPVIELRRPSPWKIVLVYIHLPHDPVHVRLARRFMESYRQFPPGRVHSSVVVCNGSRPTPHTQALFAGLPGLQFLEHDDTGWDIGAYQKAAREVPCSMMVFCGGSTHFQKEGWLLRMAEVFEAEPKALYGAMGHQGALPHVYPHLRTNGFWLDPVMLNAYPRRIIGQGMSGDRYEFEHGKNGLTQWVRGQKLKACMVTWDGVYEWPNWDTIPNGYHQGDQSALLLLDRMTDPPFYQSRRVAELAKA